MAKTRQAAAASRRLTRQIRQIMEKIVIRRNRLDLASDPDYKDEITTLAKMRDPKEQFYELLAKHYGFTEDDGMFFLPEQHGEYLKQKAKASRLVQAELFASDESSAIGWLRQRLKEKPQTYQSINPDFMQQPSAWNRSEQQLELKIPLEQKLPLL